MRTTVTLDDDLVAALEERRRRRGTGFKQELNDLLRAGLVHEASAPAVTPATTTPTYDLGESLIGPLDDIGAVLGRLDRP